MVLIPLSPTALPPAVVNVPGPGPVESHSSSLVDDEPPPPPPPETKAPLPPPQNGNTNRTDDLAEGNGDGSDIDDDDDDDVPRTIRKSDDPYANLEGAFGTYIGDDPRPMAAGGAQGRNDMDDLLF